MNREPLAATPQARRAQLRREDQALDAGHRAGVGSVRFRPLDVVTTVGTLEARYGVDLNARSDLKLRTLLRTRGFPSWTQLHRAYRGVATRHARTRHVLLSFHAQDKRQVAGLRLLISNPHVDVEVYDQGLGRPVNSERGRYVKSRIEPRIRRSEVLACLLGNGTAWRDGVDWEIRTAAALRKGICPIRLPNSRAQVPPALLEYGVPVWPWGVAELVAAIEQAAARRS